LLDEPIDGTRAVRYELHADLAEAAAEQPALRPTTAGSLTGLGYTIWLDENNHPVRTLVDEPIPPRQARTAWTRTTPVGESLSPSAHQTRYRSASSKDGGRRERDARSVAEAGVATEGLG
jgi:hypothetical protein